MSSKKSAIRANLLYIPLHIGIDLDHQNRKTNRDVPYKKTSKKTKEKIQGPGLKYQPPMKRYNKIMEETDEQNRPRNPRQVANMKYNQKKKDPELASSGNAGEQAQCNLPPREINSDAPKPSFW